MKRNLVLSLLAAAAYCLGVGASILFMGASVFPGHQKFIVTSSERCLPEEGAEFSINYTGRGTATFVVTPPTTTATVTTTTIAKGGQQ